MGWNGLDGVQMRKWALHLRVWMSIVLWDGDGRDGEDREGRKGTELLNRTLQCDPEEQNQKREWEWG